MKGVRVGEKLVDLDRFKGNMRTIEGMVEMDKVW